ncbi:unnamed protein product [Penicillium pancosmium]
MSSVLPPYLAYYQEYGLIICSTHQSALHKTKILHHMTKLHHETALNQSDLDTLHLASLATAHHIITSDQPVAPIPTLKPPQRGFQCKQCKFIRLSQKNIRDHMCKAHLIQGYQPQDQEIASCLVQALHPPAYLFTVADQSRVLPTQPSRKRLRELSIATPSQRLRVDQSQLQLSLSATFLERFHTLRQSLKQSRIIQATGEPYEARGFFSDSQYPIYLSGRDAADLEVLFALENPDHMIWLSAILYHLLSQGDILIRSTSIQSLGALNCFSQDPTNQASLRPLRSLQSKASMQKYCHIFQAFLNFLLQTYRYQENTDSEDETLPELPQAIFDNPLVQKGRAIPLYAFLACYSRDYSRDCFKPLEQICHSYSAIIKSHQLTVLYWLHTVKFTMVSESDGSMALFIRDWMRQYFTAQSESPLGHVLVLRGLAFAVMKASTSLGKISLIGPNTLRYGYITISQQDLRVLVSKSLSQLALGLSNELFLQFANFKEILPTLNLQKASSFEDINNPTANWSVLSVYLSQEAHDFLLQKALAQPNWI